MKQISVLLMLFICIACSEEKQKTIKKETTLFINSKTEIFVDINTQHPRPFIMGKYNESDEKWMPIRINNFDAYEEGYFYKIKVFECHIINPDPLIADQILHWFEFIDIISKHKDDNINN
ncbi:MAG: hypothetical protein ACRCTQ_02855 [Brevinemataceae bacterium]